MITEGFCDAVPLSQHIRFDQTRAFQWRRHYHRDPANALDDLNHQDEFRLFIVRPVLEMFRIANQIEEDHLQFGPWTSFVCEWRAYCVFRDLTGATAMRLLWSDQ